VTRSGDYPFISWGLGTSWLFSLREKTIIFLTPHEINNTYGIPISPNVAILMIEDGYNIEPSNCDILFSQHNGNLQKISKLHPFYIMYYYFQKVMIVSIQINLL
jgi:hypothetical protein